MTERSAARWTVVIALFMIGAILSFYGPWFYAIMACLLAMAIAVWLDVWWRPAGEVMAPPYAGGTPPEWPEYYAGPMHYPVIEEPSFIVRFADQDMEDETFGGHGAEDAAHRYFDMRRTSWTVSLFKEIRRG